MYEWNYRPGVRTFKQALNCGHLQQGVGENMAQTVIQTQALQHPADCRCSTQINAVYVSITGERRTEILLHIHAFYEPCSQLNSLL